MPQLTDFFRFIWPVGARYCISLRAHSNRFFDTVEDAVAHVATIAPYDVYHAVAGYQPGCTDKKDESIFSSRCFYLDLDVSQPGSGKLNAFPDQRAALAAALTFCNAASLPVPNAYTSSGWGLHVYWVVEPSLTREQWQPIADGIANAATAAGLHFDVAVTRTMGRILRTPETTNNKDPANPRPTKLLHCTFQPIPVAQLQHIAAAPRPLHNPRNNINSDLTNMNYAPVSIRGVVKECAVLRTFMMTNGKIGGRAAWIAMLATVYNAAEGSIELADHMSRGHPTYTRHELERQWAYTERNQPGPALCRSFEDDGPTVAALCKACPHHNNISTPMKLGRSPAAMAPPPPPSAAPQLVTYAGQTLPVVHPPQPFYYEPGRGRGYYAPAVQPSEGDPGSPPRLLIPGRISDIQLRYGIDGAIYLLIEHFDVSHMKHFVKMEYSRLTETASAYLQSLGLLSRPSAYREAKEMLVSWQQQLIALGASKTDTMEPPSMGWTKRPDGTVGFTLGNQTFWQDGTIERLLRSAEVANIFEPRGSYETWRDAVQKQLNLFSPALQVAIASAFAGPLVKLLTMQEALLLNLTSQGSGLGKSTATRSAVSVMADTEGGQIRVSETPYAAMNHCALMKNVSVYWDEMRGVPDDKMIETIMALAEGTDRGRLTGKTGIHGQQLRAHTGTWQTLVVVASNRNLRDKALAADGSEYYGATTARVFEAQVSDIEERNSDVAELGNIAARNPGWAGADYIARLVPQYNAIVTRLRAMQRIIDTSVPAPTMACYQGERFYRNMITVLVTGAQLANEWGILQFDVPAIATYLREQVLAMRAAMPLTLMNNPTESAQSLLSDFLNDNTDHMVVIVHPTNKDAQFLKHPVIRCTPQIECFIGSSEEVLLIDQSAWGKWIQKSGRMHSTKAKELLTKVFQARWNHPNGNPIQRTIARDTQVAQSGRRCCVIPATAHPFVVDLFASYKRLGGLPVLNAVAGTNTPTGAAAGPPAGGGPAPQSSP